MKLLPVLALLVATLSPAAAHAATTIGFSYAGADPDDSYVTTQGSGSFTFDGTGAITLANLTGFAFAQTTTLADPALTGTGSFSYGLADLTAFTGTYLNGMLSSLTLRTGTVADATGFLADQSFQVRSLRGGGASTAFDARGADQATLGTVRIAAPVPEPASWALLLLGTGMVGGVLRRRRPLAARPA